MKGGMDNECAKERVGDSAGGEVGGGHVGTGTGTGGSGT